MYEIDILECGCCGNEIKRGEKCCGNKRLIPTNKTYKAFKVDRFDYFERLSKLRNNDWFYLSH